MTGYSGTIDEQQMLVATFFLGDAAFGLNTVQVQEVVRVGSITPVRHASEFVLGVMNLRGRIATVIDLAAKLELRRTEIDEDSRIFIVEWEGEQIGLLVDQVADAIAVDGALIKPAPENVRGIQGRQFKGVFHANGRLIALLDMETVLSTEDPTEAVSTRRD
jgi:purine-binding chemotaxis protein CheW